MVIVNFQLHEVAICGVPTHDTIPLVLHDDVIGRSSTHVCRAFKDAKVDPSIRSMPRQQDLTV